MDTKSISAQAEINEVAEDLQGASDMLSNKEMTEATSRRYKFVKKTLKRAFKRINALPNVDINLGKLLKPLSRLIAAEFKDELPARRQAIKAIQQNNLQELKLGIAQYLAIIDDILRSLKAIGK